MRRVTLTTEGDQFVLCGDFDVTLPESDMTYFLRRVNATIDGPRAPRYSGMDVPMAMDLLIRDPECQIPLIMSDEGWDSGHEVDLDDPFMKMRVSDRVRVTASYRGNDRNINEWILRTTSGIYLTTFRNLDQLKDFLKEADACLMDGRFEKAATPDHVAELIHGNYFKFSLHELMVDRSSLMQFDHAKVFFPDALTRRLAASPPSRRRSTAKL